MTEKLQTDARAIYLPTFQGGDIITAFNLHKYEMLNKMTNSTYRYNVLDTHCHITSLWYIGVSWGNQMHPFDWDTFTCGRLPCGFNTLTLHNEMFLTPTSVSHFGFFLLCSMFGIVCNNLPDEDIQLNTEASSSSQKVLGSADMAYYPINIKSGHLLAF